MPPQQQKHYRDVSTELLAAGPAVRQSVFGRYTSIDPADVRRLGVRGMHEKLGPVQVDPRRLGLPKPGRGGVRLDKLGSTWGFAAADPILPEVPGDIRLMEGSAPAGDPSIPWPGYHKTVQFRVRELHCVDETNPEIWGASDEIAIGGVGIDTDGTIVKVEAKEYDEFDDGNSEWFNPPWKFSVFTVPPRCPGDTTASRRSSRWPRRAAAASAKRLPNSGTRSRSMW